MFYPTLLCDSTIDVFIVARPAHVHATHTHTHTHTQIKIASTQIVSVFNMKCSPSKLIVHQGPYSLVELLICLHTTSRVTVKVLCPSSMGYTQLGQSTT